MFVDFIHVAVHSAERELTLVKNRLLKVFSFNMCIFTVWFNQHNSTQCTSKREIKSNWEDKQAISGKGMLGLFP